MALLLLILVAAPPQDTGKVKSFEKSVDKDGDSDRKSKSSDDRKQERQEHLPGPPGSGYGSQKTDWESSSLESEFFRYLFYPVLYPLQVAITDNGRRFDWYPYYDDDPYYQDRGQKTLALQFSASVGRIDDDVRSLNVEGVASWTSACDLRFDLQEFREKTEAGTDRLEIQQYQLNFSLTPGPGTATFSLGVGVATLDGEESSEVGFTTQVNLAWFPVKPLGVRLYAGHILFEDASVGDLRIEAGIHINRFVVTAGVRSLLSSGGEDLTGPTVGLSVFF